MVLRPWRACTVGFPGASFFGSCYAGAESLAEPRGLVAASYAAQQMPGALGVQSDRPATHDASERRSG